MQIDKAARWGDLESDEEESSEEEEEEEEEDATVRGDDEESLADGLASVGGVSSLPSGLETPEVIDLRKAKAGGRVTSIVLLYCYTIVLEMPGFIDLCNKNRSFHNPLGVLVG